MERDPGSIRAEATESAPAVPRQRWRLVLARSVDAPALAGRELTDAWEVALEATGLPTFRPPGRARARVAFGAPLSAGLTAERELADIVLTESVPIRLVRERLNEALPSGWTLVDLYDVWLGGPALAGIVVAADYRIEIGAVDPSEVSIAAQALLAADRLARERAKGGGIVAYDLRPLLVDVEVVEPGPPVTIRARTRFDPALGTGRPEEVVAALGERMGAGLVIGSMVRERLVLSDD